MEWSDVLKQCPVYLNLGGFVESHGRKEHYDDYVSIDINPVSKGLYSVQHDLRKPIPVPDNVVDRILSEDFLEHLKVEDVQLLLPECYRILKPEGFMRIGVPDYNSPRMKRRIVNGKDPEEPTHLILPTFEWVKKVVEESPFPLYKFYHYWDEDKFICNHIDYTLGWIKRTPDNDPRNRRGNRISVTSIVVDVFKTKRK